MQENNNNNNKYDLTTSFDKIISSDKKMYYLFWENKVQEALKRNDFWEATFYQILVNRLKEDVSLNENYDKDY